MACCLTGTKPLSEPMLETNVSGIVIVIHIFQSIDVNLCDTSMYMQHSQLTKTGQALIGMVTASSMLYVYIFAKKIQHMPNLEQIRMSQIYGYFFHVIYYAIWTFRNKNRSSDFPLESVSNSLYRWIEEKNEMNVMFCIFIYWSLLLGVRLKLSQNPFMYSWIGDE